MEEFEALPLRNFAATDEIEVGAFLELKAKRGSNFYFIGPRAGGTEVIHHGQEVLVITPSSPLGMQIVGRKQGDKVQLQIAGVVSEFRIATVA
jgi:hypothetical protein